ncbi:MAG TPA: efflux RND transporter permease subunit, partial [Planctomycetota bacterium]|nr:efflux RND transporter permease subunit [Planctomycetota bacterium]
LPEVASVVGKIGRAETALDPAPVSMIETVVTYKPEWGEPDPETGRRIRNWREHIRNSDDIWKEVERAAAIVGSTGAPKLHPIEARLVMLQSGFRSPLGVKVYGRSPEDLEAAGRRVAELLKLAPGVDPAKIQPDRVVAKPYLEIELDRERLARYGVSIRDAQDVVEAAVGGMPVAQTVEGRERYAVRVRYARELRDSVEAIGRVLVPAGAGSGGGMGGAAPGGARAQVPLGELASITMSAGPQEIKSEGAELVAYVIFDRLPDWAEVDVAESVERLLREKAQAPGGLGLPSGVHWVVAGTYENQQHFMKTFVPVLLLSLASIFLILYLQFRSSAVTLLVVWQIGVVAAGGFIGMWLAAQPWFLDFSVLGRNLREVFHLEAYNLSVAVWVGFIALFGIVTDDAVVIITYLNQLFAGRAPGSIAGIRALVVEGGRKRVRPCLMTTAATALALLPVLTSSGRGADVMIPMALPIVGGVTFELVTLFITPVLYSALKEFQRRTGWSDGRVGLVMFLTGVLPTLAWMLIYNARKDQRAED